MRAGKSRMRGGDLGGCRLAAKLAATLPAIIWRVCSTSCRAAQADSDGDTVDLETLVAQLLEFLLTVAGSARMAPCLAPSVPELMRATLGAPPRRRRRSLHAGEDERVACVASCHIRGALTGGQARPGR